MKSLLRVVACLSLCVSLNSFGAILGSSTINFNSSGSSWFATPLVLIDGSSPTHHTIQITSLTTNYNNGNTDFLPSGLNFIQHMQGASRTMTLNIVDTNYIKTLQVGPSGTWTSDGSTNDFIGRLMPINPNFTSSGSFYPNWTGHGSVNSSAYGALEIIAYGTSPVPLPAGIYLFLSGLVGLGLMRGRNA